MQVGKGCSLAWQRPFCGKAGIFCRNTGLAQSPPTSYFRCTSNKDMRPMKKTPQQSPAHPPTRNPCMNTHGKHLSQEGYVRANETTNNFGSAREERDELEFYTTVNQNYPLCVPPAPQGYEHLSSRGTSKCWGHMPATIVSY